MSDEFDFKELAEKLAEHLVSLNQLKDNANGKWMVVSKGHVYVGDGNGINHTGLDIRGVYHQNYVEFDSFDEAQRHINPYLTYGYGKPIISKPIEATVFYAEEIKTIEELLLLLRKHLGL